MASEPLYGDPANNALIWSKYAVLFGALAATIPTANAAFTLNDSVGPVVNQWDPIGSLDTDAPFDSGQETITSQDHSAAGLGVYGTSFRDQKEVITFTAKETRLVTLGIMYDGSGLTNTSGTIAGTLKFRDPSKTFLVAFQRSNALKMERRISKAFAQIGSITRNSQNDEGTVTVAVNVFPNASNQILSYYLGPN